MGQGQGQGWSWSWVGFRVRVGVRVRTGVRVGMLGELLLIFDSEESRVGPFVGPRAAVGQRPTPQ